MNFRAKLLAILIPLIAAVISGVIFLTVNIAGNTIRDAEKNNLRLMVEKTHTELKNWADDRKRDAQLYAGMEEIVAACRGKGLEAAQEKLKEIHTLSPFCENIYLADRKGKIFMDALKAAVGIMIEDYNPKAVGKVLSSGNALLDDALKSPATGRPVVVVLAPVFYDSEIVGILGTPIELRAFSDEYINSVKIGKTGRIYMFDRSGNILAHRVRKNILSVDMTRQPFGKTIIAKKNGEIAYEWKGKERIAVFRTFEEKGWAVVASILRDEFVESTRHIQFMSIIIGVVSLLLITVTIFYATVAPFTVIREAGEHLEAAATEINSASRQLSSAGEELASSASEQAEVIGQNVIMFDDLTATSARTAALTGDAEFVINDGIAKTTFALKALNDVICEIEMIESDSSRIGQVTDTIDNISFQTNLLALNAAVEAARAGESGAGFAVVAEEVRSLATRSGEAARDTQRLLEGMQTRIVGGAEALRKMGADFEAIVASAATMGDKTAAITDAGREQAEIIEKISKSAGEIESVTQIVAANAEESATASEELTAQAGEMRRHVYRLTALIGKGRAKKK